MKYFWNNYLLIINNYFPVIMEHLIALLTPQCFQIPLTSRMSPVWVFVVGILARKALLNMGRVHSTPDVGIYTNKYKYIRKPLYRIPIWFLPLFFHLQIHCSTLHQNQPFLCRYQMVHSIYPRNLKVLLKCEILIT